MEEKVGFMITYPTQDLLLLICLCDNSPRESQERRKRKGPEGKEGERKYQTKT
jgi:hypothetical protein